MTLMSAHKHLIFPSLALSLVVASRCLDAADAKYGGYVRLSVDASDWDDGAGGGAKFLQVDSPVG